MKPNILFIVIDSFRSDKFYGNNKTSITPNIDSLIKNGTYFSQAISHAPLTVPSFSSIFTGLYPFESVVREKNIIKINPNNITYIENLKDFGYGLYASMPKLFSYLGLEKIFGGDIMTYESFETLYGGLGERIVDRLNSKNMKEPWIYYIHLLDLHGKEKSFLNEIPKEFHNKKFGVNQYEQMVSAIDVWIGKFLEALNLKKTLIVLTADHGSDAASWTSKMEKFAQINIEKRAFEPGIIHKMAMRIPKSLIPFRKKLSQKYKENRDKIIYQRIKPELEKIKNLDLMPYEKRVMQNAVTVIPKVYEEMCRVPLIFAGYGISQGKIIPQQVSSVDIFSTIAEIVGLPNKKEKIHGRSLIPLIKGKNLEEIPVYIESGVDSSSSVNNVIGIRTSKYKYFRNRQNNDSNVHLYDLSKDALEQDNIAKQNPEIVQEMENILKNITNSSSLKSDKEEFSNDEIKKIEEELRKLGYI